MTLPVKITQWVDGTNYGALVSLDPATVLPALAKALIPFGAEQVDLQRLRFIPAGDPFYRDALARLVADPEVTAALTVTLDADQAEKLANEAYWAENPPPTCENAATCDNYADPTGGDYCPRCSSALAHHEQDSEDRA